MASICSGMAKASSVAILKNFRVMLSFQHRRTALYILRRETSAYLRQVDDTARSLRLPRLLVRAIDDICTDRLDLLLTHLAGEGNHASGLPHSVMHDALPGFGIAQGRRVTQVGQHPSTDGTVAMTHA